MNSSDTVHSANSTADVFAHIAARLEADDGARSLWLKLNQEIKTGGVDAARDYVHMRFVELSDRVTAALGRRSQG